MFLFAGIVGGIEIVLGPSTRNESPGCLPPSSADPTCWSRPQLPGQLSFTSPGGLRQALAITSLGAALIMGVAV